MAAVVSGAASETLQTLAPRVRPGGKDSCKKGCKECASLSDMSGLFRAVGERSSSLTALAVHFLEVNGHEKTEAWKFSAALNLAFAVSRASPSNSLCFVPNRQRMHRFRREGDRLKHRARAEFMGLQPFMADLKWRAVNWHYSFYMGDKAAQALTALAQQQPQSQSGAAVPVRPVFIPNIVPVRKSTNPFCEASGNATGWQEVRRRRIPDPQPRGKHFVSGTDDSTPPMPKPK